MKADAADFLALAEDTLEAGCPHCLARPGEYCRNTITGEQPRFGAHHPRVKAWLAGDQENDHDTTEEIPA